MDVKLPQLGMTMTEAKIVSWHVTPGSHVDEGADLVDIETTKAATSLQAPSTGTVSELLVPEGDTVPVGTVIARIDTEE